MEENNSNNPGHHLCKQGCGFYASSQYQDMCSKCFADLHPPQFNSVSTTNGIGPTSQPKQQLVSSSSTPSISPMMRGPQTAVIGTLPTSPPASILPSLKRRLPPPTNASSLSNSDVTSVDSLDTITEKNSLGSASNCHSLGFSSLPSTTSETHSAPASVRGEPSSPSPSDSMSSSPGGNRKVITRCNYCRKRVGLTGLKCRCGGTYCSLHRYSDKHGCSYDYQGMAQEDIRKSNPEIRASKIKKI